MEVAVEKLGVIEINLICLDVEDDAIFGLEVFYFGSNDAVARGVKRWRLKKGAHCFSFLVFLKKNLVAFEVVRNGSVIPPKAIWSDISGGKWRGFLVNF